MVPATSDETSSEKIVLPAIVQGTSPEALDHGALAHARLADQDRVVLLAARENLHHALDLVLAPHHGVDAPLAGHAREVGAELFEQAERLVALLAPVVGFEHAHLHADRRLLGRTHVALHLGGRHLGRHVEHLQHARGGRSTVGENAEQRVRRGYGRHVARRRAQLLGESLVIGCGIGALRGLRGDLLLHTQPHLLDLPVLKTGGEYLIGKRSLFAQDLQEKKIPQRMRGARLCGVEGGPGKDCLKRL